MFYALATKFKYFTDIKQYFLSFELVYELKEDIILYTIIFQHVFYALAILPIFLHHAWLDRVRLLKIYRFFLFRRLSSEMFKPVKELHDDRNDYYWRDFKKPTLAFFNILLYLGISYGFFKKYGAGYASYHAVIDPLWIQLLLVPTIAFYRRNSENLRDAIFLQMEKAFRLFSFLLGLFLMKFWWFLFFIDFFYYAHFDKLRFKPFRDFLNPWHDFFNVLHDGEYFIEDSDGGVYTILKMIRERLKKWKMGDIPLDDDPKTFIQMITIALFLYYLYLVYKIFVQNVSEYYINSLNSTAQQQYKSQLIQYYGYNNPSVYLQLYYIFHRTFNFFMLIFSLVIYIFFVIPYSTVRIIWEHISREVIRHAKVNVLIKEKLSFIQYTAIGYEDLSIRRKLTRRMRRASNWFKKIKLFITLEQTLFPARVGNMLYYTREFIGNRNVKHFYFLIISIIIFMLFIYDAYGWQISVTFPLFAKTQDSLIEQDLFKSVKSCAETTALSDSYTLQDPNFSFFQTFEAIFNIYTTEELRSLRITELFFSIGLWGCILFFIGFIGLVYSFRNIIIIFISIEIMLFGFLLMLTSTSIKYNDITGVVFAFCILALAGAESALGLAMLVNFYTLNRETSVKTMSKLKF